MKKCANKDCDVMVDMDNEIHCETCGRDFCTEHSMTEDSHICLGQQSCINKEDCCPEEICGQCCEIKINQVNPVNPV